MLAISLARAWSCVLHNYKAGLQLHLRDPLLVDSNWWAVCMIIDWHIHMLPQSSGDAWTVVGYRIGSDSDSESFRIWSKSIAPISSWHARNATGSALSTHTPSTFPQGPLARIYLQSCPLRLRLQFPLWIVTPEQTGSNHFPMRKSGSYQRNIRKRTNDSMIKTCWSNAVHWASTWY